MAETIDTKETVVKCPYCEKDHRTDGVMEEQHTFQGMPVWVCQCGYRKVI